MKSMPRGGNTSAFCPSLIRAPHNRRMNCILPVAGALGLLLATASSSIAVAGPQDTSATAKYPHYRMVVLGTLGGPNGGPTAPAASLNNRGDVIAQASTTTPDPYPIFLQDGFIWHGILSNATGTVRDLGALPGTNNSFPSGIA